MFLKCCFSMVRGQVRFHNSNSILILRFICRFLSNSAVWKKRGTDGPTHGPTDGRTDPHIEMRGRILKTLNWPSDASKKRLFGLFFKELHETSIEIWINFPDSSFLNWSPDQQIIVTEFFWPFINDILLDINRMTAVQGHGEKIRAPPQPEITGSPLGARLPQRYIL